MAQTMAADAWRSVRLVRVQIRGTAPVSVQVCLLLLGRGKWRRS